MLNFFRDKLLSLPRPLKRAILVLFDFVALSFAVWAAYSLRLSEFFTAKYLTMGGYFPRSNYYRCNLKMSSPHLM